MIELWLPTKPASSRVKKAAFIGGYKLNLPSPPPLATVEGMDSRPDNRTDIRDFLASRRAKITPEQVGLPTSGRRRVPGLPLRARAAGSIVLLYAQPLSRVVRLTLDDVTRADQQTLLRLGEPPSPVPEPLAELLFRWIASRDNMNTATNHACRWLFPGRRAGQPLHPDVLAALLNDLGLSTTVGRTAAIRQHVLEMPAPVAAEALSYHRVTTAKLASGAGGTWS